MATKKVTTVTKAAPVAKAPVAKAPVAKAPVAKAPVAKATSWQTVFYWILGILLITILIVGIVWGISRIRATNQATTGVNQPVASEPAVNQPAPATGSISEATVLDLGSIGSYHAVYDSLQNKWTLGIWETSAIRVGVGLTEFKLRATSVSFTMPHDGTINNSAGHIAVNGVEWTPGNPAKDASGNSLIAKGSTVTIWTDGPNESAGFQLWFE